MVFSGSRKVFFCQFSGDIFSGGEATLTTNRLVKPQGSVGWVFGSKSGFDLCGDLLTASSWKFAPKWRLWQKKTDVRRSPQEKPRKKHVFFYPKATRNTPKLNHSKALSRPITVEKKSNYPRNHDQIHQKAIKKNQKTTKDQFKNHQKTTKQQLKNLSINQ